MNLFKKTIIAASFAVLGSTSYAAETGGTLDTVDPEADRLALIEYYKERFPETPYEDYVNGIYALDADSREQWEAIEEFPPYEYDVEEGEELFNTPFANGKSFADCFENGGIGIRQNYPMWDDEAKTVVTLEGAINQCLTDNGEEPYGWKKGNIAKVSGYMAWTSRGNKINIQIPNDDAKAAYLAGKEFFYTKRGQLNLACSDCHVAGANRRLRTDLPSAALGHTSHFPTVRSKWGNIGTLHRRYEGCHRDSRSEPFKVQSEAYRNLEFFQSYMSNGLEVNGPGARK